MMKITVGSNQLNLYYAHRNLTTMQGRILSNVMRPRSLVVRQQLRNGWRTKTGRLLATAAAVAALAVPGWRQTGAEKYFSAKRTEAGSHESIKRKWIVTVSPAKRLKHRMAVTGQMKEEKKAAAVVSDVTSIDSPA
jgi:hypothetical protein